MGDYRENPDPEEEREERRLAEAEFFRLESKKEGSLEKNIGKRKRTVSKETYRNFYNEAKEFNSDISKNSFEKANLVMKYFPLRFGCGGKNPLMIKSPSQKGKIFREIVNYSLKRI